jgi:hypothetical protein
MSVYDENGNLTEVRATAAAQDIRQIAADMYEELFEGGMTVVEARALVDYLTSEIDYAALCAITKHQLNQLIGEGQIDQPNAGSSADGA